ncbi:MAG TPA: DJ-1/PfpI family protein [Acidimicrobiales bacterium]|jgi:transcriptional regulator GlxA family with amidase domain|nr:DJ-1/PfpI family protein [Acidimicrobiales bacterium]HVE25470.1 DJ-1/PfpI family protein [Sporichthya sp.]
MAKTIAVLLFDGVEELDAIGPFEVLAGWTRMFPDEGWRTTTVGLDGPEPIRCGHGLVVTPETSFDAAGRIDLLVYPGGRGARERVDNEAHLDWVRKQVSEIETMTSVCTGALVLAAAGLLHDRPATTHWGALDRLAEIDPTIDVRREDRYVDDGDIVTAAGISAGIDMALHLVARLGGEDQARRVRKFLQYDPAPPV